MTTIIILPLNFIFLFFHLDLQENIQRGVLFLLITLLERLHLFFKLLHFKLFLIPFNMHSKVHETSGACFSTIRNDRNVDSSRGNGEPNSRPNPNPN